MSLALPITQDNGAQWRAVRLGRFTASPFHELICANGKPTQSFISRCATVAAERLTGMEAFGAQTSGTEWGVQWETEAFAYLSTVFAPLEAATFVPFGEDAGCTPDGYAMVNGKLSTVEIKCPFNSSNFLRFAAIGDTWDDLEDMGRDGPKYAWQIASQARFCGTEQCTIAYYDPRMPEGKKAIWRTYPLTSDMVDRIDEALAMARIERDKILAAHLAHFVQ